jgi:hypothetical protein
MPLSTRLRHRHLDDRQTARHGPVVRGRAIRENFRSSRGPSTDQAEGRGTAGGTSRHLRPTGANRRDDGADYHCRGSPAHALVGAARTQTADDRARRETDRQPRFRDLANRRPGIRAQADPSQAAESDELLFQPGRASAAHNGRSIEPQTARVHHERRELVEALHGEVGNTR